jgi:hypothetical protein
MNGLSMLIFVLSYHIVNTHTHTHTYTCIVNRDRSMILFQRDRVALKERSFILRQKGDLTIRA